MPDKTDNIFRLAPLDAYPLKKRFVIRAADLGFYLLIRVIGWTVRFETTGAEHLAAIESSGALPIYATWHDRIFLGTHFLRNRGIVFLASKSADGEYIARFLQRFGYGVIRGSSSRGGARGLVEMIRAMKSGLAMGFTVDGPRGPRYEAKAGTVVLAKKTGNPILPFIVEPRKYWTLGSWDKMQIPKPFTRALMMYGEPMLVDSNADKAELDAKLGELQTSLDNLVLAAEQWRET